MSGTITTADESRHVPSDDVGWFESWIVECAAGDASFGLRMELRLHPQESRSQFSLLLIRADLPVIWIEEADAPMPRPGLELRSSGLWVEFMAQDPLAHFTADLEAFALQLDDPGDATGRGYGHRVPVACELEWQTQSAVKEIPSGYEMPAIVIGEFQYADQVLPVQTHGWRSHTWGSGPRVGAIRGRAHDGGWDLEDELGIVIGWGHGLDGEQHRLVETTQGIGWRTTGIT